MDNKFDELLQDMRDAKNNLDSAFLAMQEYMLGAIDILSEEELSGLHSKLISMREEFGGIV